MMADSSSQDLGRARRSHSESLKPSWKIYYRLIKPGIVYSNVMTGTSGYLLASKWHVSVGHFIALILGMGLLIAGSCVFNNYIDRGLDERMERTKARAIPAGQISAKQALSFGTGLLALGFIALLNTNRLTLLLGVLAVIFYVVIYGLAKRHTVYGTLVGTLPGGASLVAGYAAFTNKFTFMALLLLLLMACWQMAHFYSIAIYRLKDYTAAGLPLWPIRKGIESTIKQIRLFILGFILISSLLTVFGYVGYVYLAVMVPASAYWLNVAYIKADSSNQTAWAKRVFLTSLVVLLLMSAMLPISKLIP